MVVIQRSVCFPVLIKQTRDDESARMSMKEAVVQNLAGPVKVVRSPLLPVPTTCTPDGRKGRIPSAARMIKTLAASAHNVPAEIDTRIWRALKNSQCCEVDNQRLLQLYLRELVVANVFPGYTISNDVKKLRIKTHVVNIPACLVGCECACRARRKSSVWSAS